MTQSRRRAGDTASLSRHKKACRCFLTFDPREIVMTALPQEIRSWCLEVVLEVRLLLYIIFMNKKLLETSATLVVTSALLVVTRS